MLEASTIIPIIFLAASLAALYTYYQKRILGDFVRLLSQKGADCAENAVSVRESVVNPAKALLLGFALKNDSLLGRFVKSTDDEAAERRYYLDSSSKDEALRRYESRGLRFVTVIICIAILGAFAIAVHLLAPYIATLLGTTDSPYVPDDINAAITETVPESEEETEEKDGIRDDVSSKGSYESRFETAE